MEPVGASSSVAPQPAAPAEGFRYLWGLTRDSRFWAVSLAITALFVFFEARYNLDLLNTLSNPYATRDSVDALSHRGKLLGSLGISWVFARTLITRVRPPVIGLCAFLGCAALVYAGLDQTYTRVIANLDPEVKVEGFNLFSYRRDLLTDRLFDPDIPLPKEHPVEGRILMGSFPIVLLDDRFMLPAQDIVARKAADKGNQILAAAQQQWPAYLRQMVQINRFYQEFINGSRTALMYRAFGGIQKFQQRTGGLKPNPNLTRWQFLDVLRTSSLPQAEQLRQAEAREIGRRPDGTIVHAGDVPYFMDHRSYIAWFEAQANEAKAQALPTADTVESFKDIRDINAAVFLPPMAIITSLTSAVTNGVTLVIMLIALALGLLRATRPIGIRLRKFSTPLMMAFVAIIVTAMPSHVFSKGTPLYDLETLMHTRVGFAGHLWSRLSGIQALLLK